MRPIPRTVPIATRIAGVMRLFSKEYFTRNTIPRKRTKPPIQAKSLTPKNASQSMGGRGGAGCFGGGPSRGVIRGATSAGIVGGNGGGATGEAARVGIASTTGVGDATKPLARDSNSPTRRTRLRTLALSWWSWTMPIINSARGATMINAPRQTYIPSISASQSSRTIDKFPRHVEAIRQVRRQRLHAECFSRVMTAEKKVDSEIARRHRRPMRRFARDERVDLLSRHRVDFGARATRYQTDRLRLLRTGRK